MKMYMFTQKIGMFDKARLIVTGKIVGKVGYRVLKIDKFIGGEQLSFVLKKKWFDLKLFKLPYDSECIDWIQIKQETIDKMNNQIPELKEIEISKLNDIEEIKNE